MPMSEFHIDLTPESYRKRISSQNVEFIHPPDNEMKLLAYIITDNHPKLQELLTHNSAYVNYFYETPYQKTALEIACSEYGSQTNTKCVEILIEHGANVEEALDAAAEGGNPAILKLLLDKLKKNKVDLYTKMTVVELVKFVHKFDKNEDAYVEVMNLLVNTEININAIDSNGMTAIYLAATFKYKKFIEIFLSCSEINLDDEIPEKIAQRDEISGKTARNLIISGNLFAGNLPYNVNQQDQCDRSALDQYIQQKRQTKFITKFTIIKPHLMKLQPSEDEDEDIDEYDEEKKKDIRYTYFCKACESGLDIVVKFLLCDGIDLPMEVQDKTESPLYLACLNGYYKVVAILLEYADYIDVNFTFIQLLALRKIINDFDIKLEVSYRKCFDLILDHKKLDVNYCLMSKKRERIDGKTALYYAIKKQNYEIVRTILRKGASLLYLYPWEVFLDAKNLIEFLNESVKPNKNGMTKIHIASLLPSEKDENEPETKFLRYLGTNPELHSVLHHPIIQILLSLKWKTVRTFYDINLIVFLMFSITLTLYLILNNIDNNDTEYIICFFLIISSYIVLIFRELMQVYIFRKEYFYNYENYIEIGILSLTAKILYAKKTDSHFNQLAAVLILLTTIESLLLIGRQSPLLFISINVLKTVSKTLIKWLFPYLILVFAFASSFYLLFKGDKNDPKNNAILPNCTKCCKTDDDEDPFKDIFHSFFRSLVMLTGEFDTGNINFENSPGIGHTIFIVYVFLMNTVLFGVCTALAFSETQLLMKNAEVRKEIYRIEHIAYWESVLRKSKTIQNFLKIEKLFQKNFLIIKLTEGSKVYIMNNPDPYKHIKSFLPSFSHRLIELVCRDDLPYIIYLEKHVVKGIEQLINERKQERKRTLKTLGRV